MSPDGSDYFFFVAKDDHSHNFARTVKEHEANVARYLTADQLKIYDLIWKRTVASQMADARGFTVTVRLGATATDGRDAEFSSSGTVITSGP